MTNIKENFRFRSVWMGLKVTIILSIISLQIYVACT